MNITDLKVIQFCALEVDRQKAEPKRVYNMIDAWLMVCKPDYQPVRDIFTVENLDEWIRDIGKKVEPYKNRNGYRNVSVMIGDSPTPPPFEIPYRMKNLCQAIQEGAYNADETYKEFQLIHPFTDGNGRTGKVLYNWMRGTLDDPQMPPDFFGCANP